MSFAEIETRHVGLTEYEFDGLSAKYGFADGHAFHDLDVTQMAIVAQMPAIWTDAGKRRQRDVEREFAHSFYSLAQQVSVADGDNFRICTSASQSIDLACAWAARSRRRIALVEPTFDNLALIARRRGERLQPIPEAAFPEALGEINTHDWDILFLVIPNNPTGKVINLDGFRKIVAWCAKHRKTLFVDFCFRFFCTCSGDYYQVLEDSGLDYIAIEDTGKTWPTLDLKASLIAYSETLKREIQQIFHEIFLAVSPFSLLVLTAFITDTRMRGLDSTLWSLVRENRRLFREAIAGSMLKVSANANHSELGMEWLQIDDPRYDDLKLTERLKEAGIACLPGRFFHWSLKSRGGQKNVRFALLKPKRTIERGLPQLAQALSQASSFGHTGHLERGSVKWG